jgi:TP901 family phage tail tape measure protein
MSEPFESLVAEIGGDLSGLDKALHDGDKKLSQFGQGASSAGFDGWIGKITSSFSGLGGEIASFGKSLTGWLAPVSALGALALAASSDVNKAFREIRVGTGATGENLAALKKDFANVFSTVPASAADAGLAIAKLNQLTGAVGPVLEGLATQELNLARITGGDLKEQVESTAKAFNNWKVSTDAQGPALDTLFRISQLTGVSVTALAQQVTAGGASARAAGLSFQDTALLMGQLGKAGVDASGIMQGFARSFKQIATKDKDADPAAVLQDVITQDSRRQAQRLKQIRSRLRYSVALVCKWPTPLSQAV